MEEQWKDWDKSGEAGASCNHRVWRNREETEQERASGKTAAPAESEGKSVRR